MTDYSSNIWKYYIFSFLAQFTVFLPFIIYYFQNLGFSLGQIAILQSVSAVTVFIFEVPSGYVADRIGRKNSLIIGSLMAVASVFVLYSSMSYLMLILAHALDGLAMAFVSGADSALIYDTLKSEKREKDYKKVQGKALFFGEISVIIAAILSSMIVSKGIRLTILLTLIGYALMMFTAFSLREPPRKCHARQLIKVELKNLLSIVKKSLRNKRLLGLFCYAFVILGVSHLIFISYQPYFRATSVPLVYYGYIFAIFSIFTALTSLKAHDIEEKIGIFWSLLLMPLFLVVSLVGSSIVFMWAGFTLFFFRELVRGFVHPVLGDYINKIVKSSERATVLSVGSMFSRVGTIVFCTSFGFMSDVFGIRIALMVFGILAIPVYPHSFEDFKMNSFILEQ